MVEQTAQKTHLNKFCTRYYDSHSAHWTQQDPIAGSLTLPISLNGYVYAAANPVNLVDLSGAAPYDSVTGNAGTFAASLEHVAGTLYSLNLAIANSSFQIYAYFFHISIYVNGRLKEERTIAGISILVTAVYDRYDFSARGFVNVTVTAEAIGADFIVRSTRRRCCRWKWIEGGWGKKLIGRSAW